MRIHVICMEKHTKGQFSSHFTYPLQLEAAVVKQFFTVTC